MVNYMVYHEAILVQRVLTEVMSNFRTSFMYVGMLVKRVYPPQSLAMFETIMAYTGIEVNILFHGTFNFCILIKI